MKWSMAVGEIRISVQGHPRWVTPLARAWADWTSDFVRRKWTVELAEASNLTPPTAPLFETLPRCQAGRCTLEAPGFEGYIVPEAHTARLHAHPAATPGDMSYFVRVACALQAFTRGGLLFHAAGIVHQDQGYGLFGLSGSGKTTAAKLSAPDPILNDDLVMLWPDADAARGWCLEATPFGKRRGDVARAPLRSLLWLVKDTEIFLEPLSRAQSLGELIANTPVISSDAAWLPQAMARWEDVMADVPVYALHFRRDVSFWEVIDGQLG